MLKSMTGFARCERTTAAGVLAWELRGVNHRYLEVGLRLPEELRSVEADFRQAIAASVRRGKVDATFYLRPAAAGAREIELDDRHCSTAWSRTPCWCSAVSAPPATSTRWTCCAGPA